MIRLIIEDLKTQHEGILSQGFWALLCYRLSHPRMRCRIPVVRHIWFVLNCILRKFAEMATGIMLPESAVIGRRLTIEHFGTIIIHGSVVIGDDCIIRQGVTIGNRHMDKPMSAPQLGNRVQVGAGAKVLGAISIGDDAVIGANAVVLKDVPASAVAVGIPAQIRMPKLSAAGS
ncbi:serine acetyltransferase [Sphingobium sp. AR-3-1]|uniref:Serine acetyltransferase n=1 Tax=Sphingobium psychrophilum TaxID=2728834 RepID=A0A7X9WZU2_9SPHN|nr:serine acetyltransferase [Sphingobium psychrophilum]NML12857.1 serine acetyltransferase [Sphingobium psychrophilum]